MTTLSKRPPSLETSLSQTNPLLAPEAFWLGGIVREYKCVRLQQAPALALEISSCLSPNLSCKDMELLAQGIVKMVETVM